MIYCKKDNSGKSAGNLTNSTMFSQMFTISQIPWGTRFRVKTSTQAEKYEVSHKILYFGHSNKLVKTKQSLYYSQLCSWPGSSCGLVWSDPVVQSADRLPLTNRSMVAPGSGRWPLWWAMPPQRGQTPGLSGWNLKRWWELCTQTPRQIQTIRHPNLEAENSSKWIINAVLLATC